MDLNVLQANTVHQATPSELDNVRSPQQVFTDGYLDDPIQYTPDHRFLPTTVVKQFAGELKLIKRDFADYIQVDRNGTEPQLLSVAMFSPLIGRTQYTRVLKPRAAFTQLGIPR